jgi:hypothetical protein
MPFNLLNVDANPKTVKGQAQGYMTAILYLSPSDSSGVNLCPMAEIANCKAPCLNTAGRGGMAASNKTFTSPGGAVLPDNTVQRARLRRTALFNSNPGLFMAELVDELEDFLRKAKKADLTPVARLSGLSDTRWEKIPVWRNNRECRECVPRLHPHIFAAFPEIQFYDYTKIPNRDVTGIANYHLTYSYSHMDAYLPYVQRALKHYGSDINLAVVFNLPKGMPLPETFMGRQVVSGDESDLRFLDPKGVVVGLTAKGRAKKEGWSPVGTFAVRADHL